MSRGRRSWGGVLVTIVLAVILVVGGCAGGTRGVPAGAGGDKADRALDLGRAHRVGPPHAEAPADLTLPSGAQVRIRRAVTLGGGRLDVPDDVHEAGWWPGGSRVGDPFGSTLVAGHVDAVDQGLGVFSEILGVQRGQVVEVRSQHLRQRFTIRSLHLVPRARLGQQAQLYGIRGPRRLTLVTCAPPFVARRGGYQNLAVVTAVPAGPPRPRSRS